MDIDLWRVVFRWLHIVPVIILIGGTFFFRFVLLPAAAGADEPGKEQGPSAALLRRWKRWVHLCAGAILVSGLYNVAVIMPVKPAMPYHALFGVKLLAAICVLFFAGALVGKSEAFSAWRARPSKWLSLSMLLALLIVLISGFLRYVPDKPVPPQASDQAATSRGWPSEPPQA